MRRDADSRCDIVGVHTEVGHEHDVKSERQRRRIAGLAFEAIDNFRFDAVPLGDDCGRRLLVTPLYLTIGEGVPGPDNLAVAKTAPAG